MLDARALLENHPLIALTAVLVAVFGVGRLSRVATYDAFPPAAWARERWRKLVRRGKDEYSPWEKLADCQWCFTPWLWAICLAWALFSDLHWSWWIFWGCLGGAYLSSIVIGRDEQREPSVVNVTRSI